MGDGVDGDGGRKLAVTRTKEKVMSVEPPHPQADCKEESANPSLWDGLDTPVNDVLKRPLRQGVDFNGVDQCVDVSGNENHGTLVGFDN